MSFIENAESTVSAELDEVFTLHYNLSKALNWPARRINGNDAWPLNEGEIEWLRNRFASIASVTHSHWYFTGGVRGRQALDFG